ncbi:hypothetical protein BDB01DRAFT_835899 [Pilobolus umbonatus]|nr:hypothetical protein BDB01DRAFT_835899 [Pilobolus umbonatus]
MFSSDSSLICQMSDVLFMSATVCYLKKGITIFTSLYCKTSSRVLQVYISSAFITEDFKSRSLMSATVCYLKKGVTIFTSLYCKTSSGVLQVYISSAFITEGQFSYDILYTSNTSCCGVLLLPEYTG